MKNEMKEYWLYLESYTFLWIKDNESIIYNSISGQVCKFEKDERRDAILNELVIPENMYCVKITNADLECKEIALMVDKIRESFSGDIVDAKDVSKPLSIPPILSFHKKRQRITKEELDKNPVNVSISLGNNIVKNLTDLYIYINGECKENCTDCEKKWKQVRCCTKNNSILSFDTITKIVKTVDRPTIHILGGDILKHPEFNLINTLFNEKQVKSIYYFNLRNLTDKSQFPELKPWDSIEIMVDSFGSDEKSKLDNLLKSSKTISKHFTFLISSEKDSELAFDMIEDRIDEDCYDIKPFYTGNNIDFFQDNIFITENDLDGVQLSRRQIFSNQTININDFGKLIVTADGNIYSNLFTLPIGTVQEDIRNIVYKELKSGTGWFHIRDQKPCSDCAYQWLCPSPSNYELIIGKPNLCFIKG